MARGTRTERKAMAKSSRILILVASLALGLAYVLPIWSIQLEAPQYPEGLGMVIRINTIEGQKQHDLDNINNLNHYIGMRRIVPESIPELKIMPVVVGLLMLTGVLVAAVGRKRLLYAWTAGFLMISLVGLADFWKWEYDYGHNLDEETAIIKIPGMSYQPPLIGSREILNFTAHSWPGAGGLVAMLVAVTGVAVSLRERRAPDRTGAEGAGTATSRPDGDPHPADTPDSAGDLSAQGEEPGRGDRSTAEPKGLDAVHPVTSAMAALFLLAGCAEPAPRPLAAGVDGCADCLMVLEAGGHGAELVTRTGKVLTFDSAECLVNHLRTSVEEAEVHSLWVTDFASPETLVPAEDAYFLVSPTLGSPMGLGVTAFARVEDRDGAVNAFGGRAADWSDVRALVANAWPEGRPAMKHGGHTAELPVPSPTVASGG